MFIGKKEVTKIPFGREIIRAGQTLLFDRTNKASAALMKEKILKRATDVFDGNVPQWPTLVIFPESTCTNGTALITFKRGAFSSGVRVQPVTIKYHWMTADPCKVYGGGPGIGVILFRLLTSLHNGATSHFMDVYHPSAEEKKDDLLFAENARILMAKSLNVPVTNHSYGDVQLLLKAGKMKIRRRSLKDFNVEMHTLQEILNAKCSVDQFKYFMKKFHEAAGKSGELTKQGFFDVLKMKQNPITERIFELFDIDSDGVLQFKEFMAGIALLYYSHDKDFLADIVSEKSESGRLYFDENQFLFASKMKGFAFSRRKHYPNPVVSDQDLSRRSGDFQDVSLRSDASESLRGADNNNNTQEEGEVQEQKVWW
jgi:lysophosphatidylcholine acyltransferase/lyso-PAF acetyltransferase